MIPQNSTLITFSKRSVLIKRNLSIFKGSLLVKFFINKLESKISEISNQVKCFNISFVPMIPKKNVGILVSKGR